MATPSLRSLEKALDLLGRIVENGEIYSISDFARQIRMPHSSAYRIAATLERSGLVTRVRRGASSSLRVSMMRANMKSVV